MSKEKSKNETTDAGSTSNNIRIPTLSESPFQNGETNNQKRKKGNSFFSSWTEYTENELTKNNNELKPDQSLPDGFQIEWHKKRPRGRPRDQRKTIVYNKSHRRHITCDKDKDECYRKKRILSSRFSCPMCARTYQMEGTYRRHFISHFDSRLYACEICQMSNRDASQARLHLKEHEISKCSPCEKSFANSHVLNEHLKIHHPQISAMFNCVFCSTILPLQNYDQIEEHLASHSRLENDNELENMVRTYRGEIKEEIAVKEECLSD